MQGLSQNQVRELYKIHGYNELPSEKKGRLWRIALEVIREPMFLLLISCALLYMMLGDYWEGMVMLASIVFIISISIYQSRKTEKALSALKQLSSPRALVIREGREMRIPGRELVPGDCLLLNEGDRVAADAELLEVINLHVDESLLSGESMPVCKSSDVQADAALKKVFSGSLVVQGKGLALVTATGLQTEFGKIGSSLKNIETDQTRLQIEMQRLIRNLFIAGGLLSVGVVVAFYFSRGDFIRSLLNGLAASMAILPEEFPVVLTVFLALGAWRLSKNKVLTRKPSAIETLGSATVLCSDKTGTITLNQMQVAALYDGTNLFFHHDFGNDTGHGLLRTARRASQTAPVDPMEKAIVQLYTDFGLNDESGHELLKEYPLSRELMAMTRVLQESPQHAATVSVKGAPEAIFKLCGLGMEATAVHRKKLDEMAARGYRVIAAAEAGLPEDGILPEKQQGFSFRFLGLIGLEDPVRPEVPAAIQQCLQAGIRVIMITGDFPLTARSIALQAGIPENGELMSGSELDAISDDDLKSRIGQISIFARVVPEQKLRIVQALKANREIVAMTGDGVNDAPALKAAHIGIAMGNKGTDVAREASSLVLLDDHFASIVEAIRSGRRIYDNLQKAMSYIMAIHIPIIGLTLLPAFFTGMPVLLMPLHIIFMELIIDPVCSIAFESEQEEKGIMLRAPRDPESAFFGSDKILASIFKGSLLFVMVLTLYLLSLNEGHSEGEIRAIAFASLIIGNIFLILTHLSGSRSFVQALFEKNTALITILLSAFLLLQVVLFVPALQSVFGFEFPGILHLLPALLASLILLLIFETIKWLRYRKEIRKKTTADSNQLS